MTSNMRGGGTYKGGVGPVQSMATNLVRQPPDAALLFAVDDSPMWVLMMEREWPTWQISKIQW